MSELFREVTPEERALYYQEEWRAYQIPKFLRNTLPLREWAFDPKGEGITDRKNKFNDLRDLEDYVKALAPYGAYTSTALYTNPAKMEIWMGAELVFDIDAKDLPLKRCDHELGKVCPICLEDGKEVAINLLRILREDIGFKKTLVVYSGRGYHIRVLDKWAMELDDKARAQLLDYVLGNISLSSTIPAPTWRIIISWLKYYLSRATPETLKVAGVKQYNKVFNSSEKVLNYLGYLAKPHGIRKDDLMAILNDSKELTQKLVDRKVTVDIKRVIRLPSSLHSKVGLKVTLVGYSEEDLKKFNPLVHAVPKFRKEEVMEAYEKWLEEHEEGEENEQS